MNTADQAKKRISKQPEWLHFVELGKPITIMKCKKCNVILTQHNSENDKETFCIKCKFPDVEKIADDEIIKNIGKVYVDKKGDKSKAASGIATQNQNKTSSRVKKGGEVAQSTTDETAITTIQGAAATEINTPPVTTGNIENIGSGMDNLTSKDQRSKISQNVPTDLDGLDMTSEESDINMFDTATTASSSQQKPVGILKEPGTSTRPKFPNESTHIAFADVPSTNEKTGLPPRGVSNNIDFNTSTSDTLSQDDLFVNNEKKAVPDPFTVENIKI